MSSNVKDDTNVAKFPLGDRQRAADDLRRFADFVEQGSMNAAAGVFIIDGAPGPRQFIWTNNGGDIIRLLGSIDLLHHDVMSEVVSRDIDTETDDGGSAN